MNLPGFTAERSLARAKTGFHSAANGQRSPPDRGVISQVSLGGTQMWDWWGVARWVVLRPGSVEALLLLAPIDGVTRPRNKRELRLKGDQCHEHTRI